MTDQELIDKGKRGDAVAIRTLYERFAPRVYAVVRRLAEDDALAEDWAQEAWVQAIRALPTFRGEAQFSTWLHRIAINAALQGRRGRERRVRHEFPLEAAPTPAVPGEPALLRLRLQAALAELPAGMRQVLVLHDVEGYTHEEIAATLGVTPGTSKSQLFKARARMRQLLGSARAALHGVEVCAT